MKDIAQKTDTELTTLLTEKREEVRAFRFGMAGSQTRNTKASKNARRVIARLMTEVSRRKNNVKNNVKNASKKASAE
jgi:ribosomal protein L29